MRKLDNSDVELFRNIFNMNRLRKQSLYSRQCFAVVSLVFMVMMGTACSELDRMTKPRVQGKVKSAEFDASALRGGGVGELMISSSLNSNDVNANALLPVFEAAIRKKRPDVSVGPDGRYQIMANVIANDVSKRESDLEGTIYKWTKRRVKVSYLVEDSVTGEQVWKGIIETYEEPIASYEKKDQKSKDKALDAVIAVISNTEVYPYPSAPFFSDVVKLNFEGLALNLPYEK